MNTQTNQQQNSIEPLELSIEKANHIKRNQDRPKANT